MNGHSARRRALLAGGACGPIVASTATFAQATGAAAALSARDFFREPQISGVSLSPDGRALAGVRFVNGRRNLMVVDLASRKSLIVTNFRDADVITPRWISDQRVVFGLLDFTRGLGDQFGSGLFAIDRDAGGYRQLSERSLLEERSSERMLSARTNFHSRVVDGGRAGGKSGDELFVQVWSDQGARRLSSTLRRLNSRTGVSSHATLGGPGNVTRWVLDRNHVPRVAVSLDEGITRVHLRDGEGAPWRVIAEFGFDSGDTVEPIAFDGAGTLYVVARNGRDLAGIHRVDPRAKTPAEAIEKDPLFSLRDYDLDGTLRFSADFRVIGIDYEAERRGTHWLEKPWADLQALIDGALPGRVNRLTGDLGTADAPVLVHSYSDQDAGRYYLFDRTRRQLEQIAASRPWLETGRMAQTDVVRYKARDGLLIPAQLTLPPASAASRGSRKSLPLLVMHYGGPWVRPFHWEFDPTVQFLASRGYAVLMPAPRASTGFGFRHFRAGWKQWGLGMQDDLTDGARWLIDKGIADEKRVAFLGASYGGYAAMQALAKEPDLFRCAVNWVGVTDPAHMHSMTWTDFAALDASRLNLNVLLGDAERDGDQFRATSPLVNAARIRQPVLMAYGGLDKRVPIENGERMRAALAGHNRNVEWVVYADEGHGWLKEENNVDFWSRVERFLAKHLLA